MGVRLHRSCDHRGTVLCRTELHEEAPNLFNLLYGKISAREIDTGVPIDLQIDKSIHGLPFSSSEAES